MPGRTPLTDSQIAEGLDALDGWTRDGDRIVKEYRFADFRASVAFLVRAAFVCEAHDHHPEIHNVYDRVTLAFNTHDAGNTITETDLALARAVDALG